MTPTATTAASKIGASVKIPLTADVNIVGVGFLSPMPSGPSSGDQTSELLAEGEMEEGKKKKKAITKMPRKARVSELHDDSDERGEDPFDNPEIIQDLTDKFAMPEVVDHLADLDWMQFV